MKSKTLRAVIVSAGALAATASLAQAEARMSEADEINAIRSAKVSIEEAVRNATGKVPGKATSVQLFDAAGKPAFHVEVVTVDGKQQDLAVDASTGEVMLMAGTDEDHDGDRQEDGEQHDEGDDSGN